MCDTFPKFTSDIKLWIQRLREHQQAKCKTGEDLIPKYIMVKPQKHPRKCKILRKITEGKHLMHREIKTSKQEEGKAKYQEVGKKTTITERKNAAILKI